MHQYHAADQNVQHAISHILVNIDNKNNNNDSRNREYVDVGEQTSYI